MQLSERITQARKQAGLTQEQLGEALGVSRQAVSKWESGQANPDVAYIAEMCRLFDVSSDWLLFGKESGGAEPVRCGECGSVIPAAADFCPKCGISLDGREKYSLYLLSNDEFSWAVAKAVERLFAQPWARPAFLWQGETLDAHTALNIIGGAPMVLCRGLTAEQASQAVAMFGARSHVVKIYRDRDIVDFGEGKARPADHQTEEYAPEPVREPLSGLAIFGLVVLGVVVAILLMSLF